MDVSNVLLRLRLLRLRRKNIRNAMREIIASPPTTPPTTAAVVLVLLKGVAVGPAAPSASAPLLGDPSPAVFWADGSAVVEDTRVDGILVETAALPPAVGVAVGVGVACTVESEDGAVAPRSVPVAAGAGSSAVDVGATSIVVSVGALCRVISDSCCSGGDASFDWDGVLGTASTKDPSCPCPAVVVCGEGEGEGAGSG